MFIVKNQKETELTVNVLSVSTEPLTKEEPCIFAFGGTLGIVLTNIFNNSANHAFCLWRDAWHCFDKYLQ